MHRAGKGYEALRRGRWSQTGSEYFVTFCARGASANLNQVNEEIRNAWTQLEIEKHWFVRTAVVMPDHLHLLVRLVGDSSLEDAIRLFKGRLAPILRSVGLRWQPSFHDHRLRDSENVLGVFAYVFLNAFQAKLVPIDAAWPGYYCSAEDWAWFGELTNARVAFPEWLGDGSIGA